MGSIKKRHCDIAVIGGGAAGLAAAIEAAGQLRRDGPARDLEQPAEIRTDSTWPVVLLERQDRVGKKILTTGNGRCNLSHQPLQITDYHGQVPQFAGTALARFDVAATLDWFGRMGLKCRTDADGRVFPHSYQAAAVLDLLRRALDRLPVAVQTGSRVTKLQPGHNGGFALYTQDGQLLLAQAVIVATGGLAAPAFGCSGDGYALLGDLGHRLIEPKPAIVQICTSKELVRGLAGIRFIGSAALVRGQRIYRQEQGEILFTEYGLSGPPILQLSRHVHAALANGRSDAAVRLDFLPELSPGALVQWLVQRRDSDPQLPLSQFLTGLLHKKAGMALIKQACGRPLSDSAGSLAHSEIEALASLVKNCQVPVTGTQGWKEAQVTAGGIDVRDFDAATLSSRLVPGLFAAGEVLDIDGDCGGFNLQWAWSSGRLAGMQAAACCKASQDGGR